MTKIDMVVDLQFGSTGKGLLVDFLVTEKKYAAAVSAWGPNSGHTSWREGRPVIRTMVPLALANPNGPKSALIAPGSMLNWDNLVKELIETEGFRTDDLSLFVHENAAMVIEDDRKAESEYANSIGSTQKGTGEALMRKIRRGTQTKSTAGQIIGIKSIAVGDRSTIQVVSADTYRQIVRNFLEFGNLLVEGAQGFSLGINSGLYPYCTSRECSTAQILSDCCLPVHRLGHVYGASRTFPIRVANRYDGFGKRVGFSGPCYPDQRELPWGEVGVRPETTTVTGLRRRVFSFSMEQVRDAVFQDGVSHLFLNFCNYLDPDPEWSATRAIAKVQTLLDDEERRCEGVSYVLFGFGPRACDLVLAPVSSVMGVAGHKKEVTDRLRSTLTTTHARAIAHGFNSHTSREES